MGGNRTASEELQGALQSDAHPGFHIPMAMAAWERCTKSRKSSRTSQGNFAVQIRQARAQPLIDNPTAIPAGSRWILCGGGKPHFPPKARVPQRNGDGRIRVFAHFRPNARPYPGSPHFRVIVHPAVTRVDDVSRCTGGRYAATTMLRIAGGQGRVFSVFLVSIGLFALVALGIAIGVHLFLAAVGHYAPWEQICTGDFP
jgi:hypothetical protein